MIAALVRARRPCGQEIDTACLMLTNREWIPLEGPHELPQVEALVAHQRRFFKPLRYDARSAALFANALLLGVRPHPVALDLLSAFMSSQVRAAKERLLPANTASAWVWSVEKPMPPLPSRVAYPHS